MKLLFIRPPRYLWPFYSEKSNFWQPLAFASMASVLRNNLDIELKIIDCPILKIGWKTIDKVIKSECPDILCIGEETVSAHEALRLAWLVKSYFPSCIVIAGGNHFSFMIEDSLNKNIDFIIQGEGELTLLNLVKEIIRQKNTSNKQSPSTSNRIHLNYAPLAKIRGLAFKNNNQIIINPPGPLLNMENLPLPAYDLLPMKLYGKGASTHKDLVAIEHSRGCTSNCNFCVLWKQMGKVNNGRFLPCYRSKSAKKSFEEVKYLADKYKRKTFCWVDPSWNIDPKWNKEFSNLLIKEKLDLDHSAWMRADSIVRDEKNRIFKDQVRAGLKQVMIGIERTSDKDLLYFEKKGINFNITKSAFEIVRKYPSVLSIATYVYGLPYESKKTLRSFYDKLDKIPFDIGVPIPLTPNPGTKYFKDLLDLGLLEIKDFKYYNFINVISRSKYLSRNELLWNMLVNEIRIRTRKEQFAKFNLNGRRKNGTGNLALEKTRLTFEIGLDLIKNKLGFHHNYNIKPEWYEK